MDKTPKYIKMCTDAKEVQKNFLKLGDYYAYLPEVEGESVLIWTNKKKITCTNERIYLPRQDQLQILSKLSWVDFDNKCRVFWFQDVWREITKEQAGIRVVMDCQFNKKWQDGEWLDKTTR